MKKIGLVTILSLISSLACAGQHAFLVQNSGWMEPFYQDQNSQLKPLVNAVVQTVTTPSDTISVAMFNQSNTVSKSPIMIYKGAGKKNISEQLNPQTIAKKSDKAYADTDFKEAIIATITGPFAKKSGIIWIFTNNKNSPNNDAATIERNKEFYELVHLDPAINKVMAYPLKMPVLGQHFNASGLMIYVLAYGEQAETELNYLVQSGQMDKIFTQQPALLKPLDKEPVQLIPTGVKNSSTIHASLASDQKTLVFNLEPKDVIPELKLIADLKNRFYPYNIVRTRVEAKLRLADGTQAPIQISESDIRLMTKHNTKLEFQVPIPSHLIVSPWSWEVFKAMGKAVTIPANIDVTLYEQELSLSEDFQQSLQNLFPGDPLSDVFVAPQSIQSSTATIPVQFRLQYPLWPLVVIIAGILLAILFVVFAFILSLKRKKYDVWVNGLKRQTIQLKPFSKMTVYGDSGKEIAIIKRGISNASVQVVDKEFTIILR